MQEAEQETDGGALDGAVRSEETEDLARLHVDREVVQGDDRATVSLAQTVRDDDAHGHEATWSELAMLTSSEEPTRSRRRRSCPRPSLPCPASSRALFRSARSSKPTASS